MYVSCNNRPSNRCLTAANAVYQCIDIFAKLRFHPNSIFGLRYGKSRPINNCFMFVFV